MNGEGCENEAVVAYFKKLWVLRSIIAMQRVKLLPRISEAPGDLSLELQRLHSVAPTKLPGSILIGQFRLIPTS